MHDNGERRYSGTLRPSSRQHGFPHLMTTAEEIMIAATVRRDSRTPARITCCHYLKARQACQQLASIDPMIDWQPWRGGLLIWRDTELPDLTPRWQVHIAIDESDIKHRRHIR